MQEVSVSVSQLSRYLYDPHYQALNHFLSCSLQPGDIVTLTVSSAGTLIYSHDDEPIKSSRVSIEDGDISEIRTGSGHLTWIL